MTSIKSITLITLLILISNSCKKEPISRIYASQEVAFVDDALEFVSYSENDVRVEWKIIDEANDNLFSRDKVFKYSFSTSGKKTIELTTYSKKDKKKSTTLKVIEIKEKRENFFGNYITQSENDCGISQLSITPSYDFSEIIIKFQGSKSGLFHAHTISKVLSRGLNRMGLGSDTTSNNLEYSYSSELSLHESILVLDLKMKVWDYGNGKYVDSLKCISKYVKQ
jgi:hypothetical protein